ncbi:MAG: hypothetical protein ROO76_23840 [Terriglobia bacterium]|nr:hypothetical protein [Terriglobia bacterium]
MTNLEKQLKSEYDHYTQAEHPMACMAPPLSVKQAILEALRTRTYRPMELIEELSLKGISDSEVKEAIAQLVLDGTITLSSERTLAAAEDNAA